MKQETRVIMLYVIHKILAIFQAAVVDESDISLWWRVGTLSMDVVNLRLARFAFEKVSK